VAELDHDWRLRCRRSRQDKRGCCRRPNQFTHASSQLSSRSGGARWPASQIFLKRSPASFREKAAERPLPLSRMLNLSVAAVQYKVWTPSLLRHSGARVKRANPESNALPERREKWILRRAIAHHSSPLRGRPGMTHQDTVSHPRDALRPSLENSYPRK
jgi:hypothetical protein